MNIDTGEIVDEKDLTEEKMKSGKYIPLDDALLKKLQRMNRFGRRKY